MKGGAKRLKKGVGLYESGQHLFDNPRASRRTEYSILPSNGNVEQFKWHEEAR